MLSQSTSKKHLHQLENQKPNKKRKTMKIMTFYGFDCPHCPEEKDANSQVRKRENFLF